MTTAKDQASKGAAKKKKKRTTPRTRQFPFLKLPAELRNKIYDLCLVSENRMRVFLSPDNTLRSIRTGQLETDCDNLSRSDRAKRLKTYHGNTREYYRNGPLNEMAPQILQLNHQIHDEALPILYNQPLDLYCMETLSAFFERSHSTMPPMLGDVRLVRASLVARPAYNGRYDTKLLQFDQLSLAVNLQKFSIYLFLGTCPIHVIDAPQPANLFAEAAQKWTEMIGSRGTGETDWKKVFHLDRAIYCATFCSLSRCPSIIAPVPEDFIASVEQHLLINGHPRT
ncbi:hypothetical protein BLS_001486 [Venturia inaequalis]|uniref:2EXR domain-containing protein n=1 Tax=Venturia inaequalis TaxID=5025 RepID=A0A8H3V547_VENIN|nr:hypothetical protein BLS_001486 [Venturia inaequalis]KAE9972375.1 hypothetical protein EG328_005067 [Venturia inaequalis]KAE9981172.1 hypothetical protein EG327_006336 [Venturia inaequalis]